MRHWPWDWWPEMALPLNRGQLYFLLQLLLLGLLVGLACWPLNLVDHVQDLLTAISNVLLALDRRGGLLLSIKVLVQYSLLFVDRI